MTSFLTAAQGAGVLAVFVALFGLLPLWWALLAAGALTVVLATAAEYVVRKALSAPQNRRSGPIAPGVE